MSDKAETAERVFDRTALMTWPDLTVEVHLFPWQWRLIPRGWYDYSPGYPDGGDGARAGWWGIDGEWLFLKARFGFNLPPFMSPWLATPPEPTPEPEYVDCTCGHANDDHDLGECPFPGCGCGARYDDDCQHEWELRSEHDTWVCAWCSAETTSPASENPSSPGRSDA